MHAWGARCPALIALTLLSVVAGFRVVIEPLTTIVPVLALPSAAGLPFAIPTLRLWPLGDTTWLFWIVETVAAIVMIVVAAMRISNSRGRHPNGGRGRAFVGAMWATAVGVIVANTVRVVFLSFVTQSSLGAYVGYLLTDVVVSAVFGMIVGLLVGAVAALFEAAVRDGHPTSVVADPAEASSTE